MDSKLRNFDSFFLIFSKIVIIDVPVDLDTKPLESRLDATKEILKKIETTPNGTINNILIPITMSLPLPVLSRIPANPSLKKITFGCSNIFGPTKKASFWKKEMLDITFSVKMIPEWSGVNFSIFSYNGFVKIGISAHSVLVKNQNQADEIVNNIYSELNQMISLTSPV